MAQAGPRNYKEYAAGAPYPRPPLGRREGPRLEEPCSSRKQRRDAVSLRRFLPNARRPPLAKTVVGNSPRGRLRPCAMHVGATAS
eukprot:CAMPEP_0176268128 /NCGR_PEP_ID=MMETSP0121_2-20121125/43513_1 /TAXON_ID=160619 /ORGANISM="Kryptoperidinium foliaceum, Strain CCMP 1326" /LENGTH=84 /DNA_ID=CAMNT_0017608209 /DNA_START=53 /DNA_END=304 /DNA_ORIENTATION=+